MGFTNTPDVSILFVADVYSIRDRRSSIRNNIVALARSVANYIQKWISPNSLEQLTAFLINGQLLYVGVGDNI